MLTSGIAENMHRFWDDARPEKLDEPLNRPSRLRMRDQPIDENYRPLGVPSPILTALRGVREELSPRLHSFLERNPQSFKFLNVVFSLTRFHPFLTGIVELGLDRQTVQSIIEEAPGSDHTEFTELIYLPLDRKDEMTTQYLSKQGQWIDAGLASFASAIRFWESYRGPRAKVQLACERPTAAEDRHFMELAVNEARKCPSPATEEARPNPRVGAVIVTADGAVWSGYRGEDDPKDGRHAEYTVLRKISAAWKVDVDELEIPGATVYTTLEPCNERSPGKVACVDRILNSRASRVVYGMIDPDLSVQSKSYHKLVDNQILVDTFANDLKDELMELNKEFYISRRRARQP
jgi:diaminohydroxyphosphoribosylaminopyrimidine deaminase / 5-amino-6-(5-phosphoribosylamino)uracil reductase